MIHWITENLGTILVALIVLCVVAAIAATLIRDRRKGKCVSCDGCSGNCPHASGCAAPHKKDRP